jgi:L-lactate dehydrogenase complex protein LldF
MARGALRILPHSLTHNQSINAWAKARELPDAPKQSFKEWYEDNRK